MWDALDAANLRLGMGHAYFVLRGNRTLDKPNKGFADWGTASDDLLAVLRTWGIEPVASGKYPVDPSVLPEYAERPFGSVRDLPRNSGDHSHAGSGTKA